MNTNFPYYIEDWLLWLAAKRTVTGDEIDFPWYTATPIKLANYDVSFIMRTSSSVDDGIGLTQNQVNLAVKIVTKYQRQIWAKANKDVSYLTTNKDITRLETRGVDKTCSVTTDNEYWYIVFPYDPGMVDLLHKLSAHSAGVFKWEGTNKRWRISRNECNLSLISRFVRQWKSCPWYFDTDTQDLLNQVLIIKENKYQYIPYIDFVNGKTVLKNSNPYLDKAWESVTGMDLYNTVFRADSMGLALSEKLKEHVSQLLPQVSESVTVPQSDINVKSKSLFTYLPSKLIEQFAEHITADYWVFISYDNTNDSTGLLEAAIEVDVSGEKIFFSDKVPRLSYNYFNEIRQGLSGDVILFVDNLIVLDQISTQLAPEFRILKTFYSHGGNR